MDVAGKTALITGAKRIGARVADALAREGADVAVAYCTSRDEAEQTVECVRARGRKAVAIQADLRRPDAADELVSATVAALGRVDVLIGMASVYAKSPFDTLDTCKWETSLAVDLSAAFHCVRAVVPQMSGAEGGRIILFADSEAASGRPRHTGYLPYYVAKSGVIALGKALALELAPRGILVNTLALGPILPADGGSADEYEATAREVPVRRWGSLPEVCRAVTNLIASDYITGEVIRVDGGRHLQ